MKLLLNSKNIDLRRKLVEKLTEKSIIFESYIENDTLKIAFEENLDLIIVEGIEFNEAKQLSKTILSDSYNYSNPYMIYIGDGSVNAVDVYDAGYTDFIKKPITVDEIVKKIEIFAKYKNMFKNLLSYQEIKIYLNEQVVFYNSEKIKLTKQEFEVLAFFLKKQGILLTKQRLYVGIWGEYSPSSRKLDLYISRLKQKFPVLKDNLISKRNFGYKLNKSQYIEQEKSEENGSNASTAVIGIFELNKNILDESTLRKYEDDLRKLDEIFREFNLEVIKFYGNRIKFITKNSNFCLNELRFKLNENKLETKLVLGYGKITKINTSLSSEIISSTLEKNKSLIKLCQMNEILCTSEFLIKRDNTDEFHSIGYYELSQFGVQEVFQYKDQNIKENVIRQLETFKTYVGEMFLVEENKHYFKYSSRFKTKFLSDFAKNSEIKLFSIAVTDSRGSKETDQIERKKFGIIRSNKELGHSTEVRNYDSKRVDFIFTPSTEINVKDYVISEVSFTTNVCDFMFNKRTKMESISVFGEKYYFVDGTYNLHSGKNIYVKLVFPIEFYDKINFTPVVMNRKSGNVRIFEKETLEIIEKNSCKVNLKDKTFEVAMTLRDTKKERAYGIAWNPYIY